MIHSCEGMYTGFHLPQFQPSTMCYVETVYHLVRVSGRTIFDLDARLGRSTVSTCGIGKGRNPGEMKASDHIFTTVYHVSVYVQSSVVVMGGSIMVEIRKIACTINVNWTPYGRHTCAITVQCDRPYAGNVEYVCQTLAPPSY